MPCDYREYSKDWKWLSAQVRKRNDGRCELCYAPNGELIYRGKDEGYPWGLAENLDVHNYKNKKITRVILTVHHIDGDKNNNTEQNLLSCCQKCHLRLDMVKHMKNRSRKSAPLFEKPEKGEA